jgi:hypothetical protein
MIAYMKIKNLIVLAILSASIIGKANGQEIESTPLQKTSSDGYSVELIGQCGATVSRSSKELILFENEVNRLSGWSHAKYIEGLNSNPSIYTAKIRQDTSCSNIKTYQNILVKKYADWNAQHVNGIEPLFIGDIIKLGAIGSIILEFKVHSEGTEVPTKSMLESLYGNYLNAEQLEALDRNLINLSVTVFEAGFDERSTNTLNGKVNLELDQNLYADKWVRVIIPMGSLDYYTEQNYSKQPVQQSKFRNAKIIGLRINPETHSGKVVRHFIKSTFESNTPPEAFKKMNVSFKKIALVTN